VNEILVEYIMNMSVIIVLDSIIGTILWYPHSFSLSFARDKYIDTYIERHIESDNVDIAESFL
jgi:hypothetical protein